MLDHFAAAAALASGVSYAGCRLLMAAGPRDVPGEARKAHATPTPTSGGLAIAAGAAAGAATLVAAQPEALLFAELWTLALFPFAFLLIGYVDDARGLGVRVKAPLFLVTSLVGAYCAGAVESFPVEAGLELELPAAVALVGTALWIFTLVNAVNFIDGANGVAAGSMAIAFTGAGVIAWMAGAPSLAATASCVVAAIGGFLFWNFPAGRIFAGDAGALSLGAFGAFVSLALVDQAGVSALVAPILFFPILADVLLTMLWRARRGARLIEAHADHLYQVALRSWRSHATVAMAFWAAMAVCAVLAFLVARSPDPGIGWKVLALLAIGACLISEMVRRRAR